MAEIKSAKKYLNDCGYGTGSNFTTGVVKRLMKDYATHALDSIPIEVIFDKDLSKDRVLIESCINQIQESILKVKNQL